MAALLAHLDHPVLNGEVLKLLSNAVADLLLSPHRARVSELIGAKRALELISTMEAAFGPRIRSGLELFRESVSLASETVSTGCNSLDALLGGGARPGEWLEIVGQMATGLSGVQQQPTVNAFNESENYRVLFFDCSASFSQTRLLTMLQASPKLASAEPVGVLLSRILVVRVLSPQALLTHLTELADSVKSDLISSTLAPWRNLSMVVVDGLAPQLTPALSANKQQIGHGYLAEVSRLLKSIMYHQKCSVVTTNWMSSSLMPAIQQGAPMGLEMTKSLRPGLGESWASVANSQLVLTHVASHSAAMEDGLSSDSSMVPIISAELTKSSRGVTNHVIRLKLSQGGFSEV